MLYTVSSMENREPVKQLIECVVTATDLMFIDIHITSKHNVAPCVYRRII